MEKKIKKFNEKELSLIENLKSINEYKDLSMKDFIDNFITVKNVKGQNIIYCLQINKNPRKNSSVAAYALNEENEYSQVGTLTFGVKDTDKKIVYLDRIYVYDTFRKMGIGSTMLNIFENTCLDVFKDNVKITGCVLPDNDDKKSKEDVCSFYVSNGYKITMKNGGTMPQIDKTLKKKFSLFKPVKNTIIDFGNEKI